MIPFLLAGLLTLPHLLPASSPAPVLLELFTSQGCSSCPPAEALLGTLDREQPLPNIEIIPLAFHVDYWDRLGWKDPYSTPANTSRQYAYAAKFQSNQVYTPQAIISSSAECTGHDRDQILSLAKTRAVARLTLTLSNGHLLIQNLTPNHKVLIAETQNGLLDPIPRGENAGRKLPGHAVVLSLREFDAPKGSLSLPLKPESHKGAIVAFQESDRPGKGIISAGRFQLQ